MVDVLDRTVGLYGMSIGTSLAIEGAAGTGEYQDRTGEPPVNHFELLMVNLRTLIRNAHNAFPNELHKHLNGEVLREAVEADYEALVDTMHSLNPQCEVVLYLCTYEDIDKELPLAKFRGSGDGTPKQLMYETNERDVISYYRDNYEDLIQFKWKPEGNKRCVMMTHLPLDLVSYDKFPELKLLESHTGVLKERRHWWTKMKVKRDGPIIPFNIAMLQIFGDNSMFSPQPMKIRKVLLTVADKAGWHPLTTRAKIRQDIKLAHEPFLLEFVNRYL